LVVFVVKYILYGDELWVQGGIVSDVTILILTNSFTPSLV